MRNNLATMFLLPLLGMPKNILKETVKSKRRIINSYLFDDSIERYTTNHLFIAHINYQDLNFKQWEDKLIGQEHCVDAYDICNSHIGIKVFNMEPYDDYFLFLEGKYSQYSDWGKNRVTEFGVDDGMAAKQIIEKSPTLKKVLAEKFKVDETVFDECAPLWNSAENSNVINTTVRDYFASLCKFTVSPNKTTFSK